MTCPTQGFLALDILKLQTMFELLVIIDYLVNFTMP